MNRTVKIILATFVAVAALLSAACTSCSNTSWKSEQGNPSLENRKLWKSFLKVKNADPTKPIGTTMTHISNVSHNMAVAKINQSLQSYDAELGYKLSTVFVLSTIDSSEQDEDKDKKTAAGQPAVTAVVVQGHLYYIGMLDYRKTNDTYYEYEQTHGVIPAIAVVDGEDATKAGWIRTHDEDGKPYHIVLRFSEMVNYDDYNIYRHLRNRGYSTSVSCHKIDNPTLEVDDKWRPFFTVTFNKNDGCGLTVGNMFWPEKLLVVDAQTNDDSGIREFKLDDPTTPNVNERDPRIDTELAWVDQIYSPFIVKEYIAAWGYNLDNYGHNSHLGDVKMDAEHLDEVMNMANTNIVFTAYITSLNIDDSLVGVMLVNPRTGEAEFTETQGARAMATKTSAVNAIIQATHRWDYEVEDLTLHTIYGVPTWQGELVRPAVNDDGGRYGSLYCGMVMLQANHDHQPNHAQWGFTKHETFTKYERWLIRSHTERTGSNVEEIKELTGRVTRSQQIVIDGETNFLLNIDTHAGLFDITVDYLGNPENEAVLNTQVGDTVYLRYADPVNTQTYIVLEIRNQTRPPLPESRENEHAEKLLAPATAAKK